MLNEASLTAQDELPELKSEMRKKMLQFLELEDDAKKKISQAIDTAKATKPASQNSAEPKLNRDEFLNGFNGN